MPVSQSCGYPPRQRWVADAGAYETTQGPTLSYPPRQRWDRDVIAYARASYCSAGLMAGAFHVGVSHPPLTRWVCAGSAGRRLLVGYNIRDPPLTRWVCAGSAGRRLLVGYSIRIHL